MGGQSKSGVRFLWAALVAALVALGASPAEAGRGHRHRARIGAGVPAHTRHARPGPDARRDTAAQAGLEKAPRANQKACAGPDCSPELERPANTGSR